MVDASNRITSPIPGVNAPSMVDGTAQVSHHLPKQVEKTLENPGGISSVTSGEGPIAPDYSQVTMESPFLPQPMTQEAGTLEPADKSSSPPLERLSELLPHLSTETPVGKPGAGPAGTPEAYQVWNGTETPPEFTAKFTVVTAAEEQHFMSQLPPQVAAAVTDEIALSTGKLPTPTPEDPLPGFEKTAEGVPQYTDNEAVNNLLDKGMTLQQVNTYLEKGLTPKQIEYVESLEVSPDPAGAKEEFESSANYMVFMVKVLALMNTLKSLLASIDGDMLKQQMDAEKNNLDDQMGLIVDKMELSKIQRDKAELLKKMQPSKAAKWITFGIQVFLTAVAIVASAALMAVTGGIATPAAIAIITVMVVSTVAVMTVQMLEMLGVDLFGMVMEAVGVDEKYAWILKLIDALAVLLVCCVAVFAIGAASAGAGMSMGARLLVGVGAAGLVAAEIGPSMVMASNATFEIAMAFGKAFGMSEEEAMKFAMIMNLIAMIVMMIAVIALSIAATGAIANAPKMAGKVGSMAAKAGKGIKTAGKAVGSAAQEGAERIGGGRAVSRLQEMFEQLKTVVDDAAEEALETSQNLADDLADDLADTAAEAAESSGNSINNIKGSQGVQAAKTRFEKATANLSRLKEMFDMDMVVNAAEVLQVIGQLVQALQSIMTGVAELRKGQLKKKIAEIEYDMALLDAHLEFLKSMLPTYQRAREGILDDMQNGMMKLALEMHKVFESTVRGASQASTERNRALS